jgi:predicted nucleic acid-binding protein
MLLCVRPLTCPFIPPLWDLVEYLEQAEPHGARMPAFAPHLESGWRRLTTSDRPIPKIWTDAYLAAFARSAEMQLVTLDKAMLTLEPNVLLLS